jgi:hypothetical protein
VYVRSSADEAILIVVNFGAAVVDRLEITLGTPIGGGSRPLRILSADPSNGCSGAAMGADEKTLTLRGTAAHGFCAVELTR